MATRGRRKFEGATVFFVTTTVKERERLFTATVICDEIVSILFRTAKNTNAHLMACCLIPSHIHLIAGHELGGAGISRLMQSFKSAVSHLLFKGRHGIWIPRFDDVIICSEDVFLTKLNYTHENPVRANLVSSAVDWPWSSARFWYLDEPSEGLTKGTEWVDAEGNARRGRLAHTAEGSEQEMDSPATQ